LQTEGGLPASGRTLDQQEGLARKAALQNLVKAGNTGWNAGRKDEI
jgi:hypothetical protein